MKLYLALLLLGQFIFTICRLQLEGDYYTMQMLFDVLDFDILTSIASTQQKQVDLRSSQAPHKSILRGWNCNFGTI